LQNLQHTTWNAGAYRFDVKGETQAGGPCEGEIKPYAIPKREGR